MSYGTDFIGEAGSFDTGYSSPSYGYGTFDSGYTPDYAADGFAPATSFTNPDYSLSNPYGLGDVADSSGMISDQSWMEAGMKGVLSGMLRMHPSRGGAHGGQTPAGNVSAQVSQQPINEINQIMNTSPELSGLQSWAGVFK